MGPPYHTIIIININSYGYCNCQQKSRSWINFVSRVVLIQSPLFVCLFPSYFSKANLSCCRTLWELPSLRAIWRLSWAVTRTSSQTSWLRHSPVNLVFVWLWPVWPKDCSAQLKTQRLGSHRTMPRRSHLCSLRRFASLVATWWMSSPGTWLSATKRSSRRLTLESIWKVAAGLFSGPRPMTLWGNALRDSLFKGGKGSINLWRGRRLPLIWGVSAVDKFANAICPAESSKNCAGFEKISNDVVEGAQRRVGFLLGSGDKRWKLRVFGFFLQGWQAERKV